MLLAQISDTHLTVPGSSDKHCVEKLTALEKCVEDINNLNPLPDVVIHTGDLSHNGTYEELLLAKTKLEKLVPPYYVTPGNRDCISKMAEIFAAQFGGSPMCESIIYQVNDFPIRLVSLDTTAPDENLGVLSFDKLVSLDKILLRHQSDPVILFSHHPPFHLSRQGTPRIEFRNENSIKLFGEIIDRHFQIVALFCGHFHQPVRKNLGPFDASIAPPVCNLLNQSGFKTGPNDIGNYHLHKFGQDYEFVTDVKIVSGLKYISGLEK